MSSFSSSLYYDASSSSSSLSVSTITADTMTTKTKSLQSQSQSQSQSQPRQQDENDDSNYYYNANPTIPLLPNYVYQYQQIQLWRQYRSENLTQPYNFWFGNEDGTGKLKYDADSLVSSSDPTSTASASALVSVPTNGPILDFAVSGFPKCGTSAVIGSLQYSTPYGGGDICTPVDQTVYYAYKNWIRDDAKKNKYNNNNARLLKGTKCPKFLENGMIEDYGKKLPKTVIMVGIRHPVLWFQSFYNMQMANFGKKYESQNMYDVLPKATIYRNSWGCIKPSLFCVERSKFYLPLSRLGKTNLLKDEQQLLTKLDYYNPKWDENYVSSTIKEKHKASTRSSKNKATIKNVNSTNSTTNTTSSPTNTTHVNAIVPNTIILYDYKQPLIDEFWDEVSYILMINRTQHLPPVISYVSDSTTKHNMTQKELYKKSKRTFDICSNDRDPLRQLLLPISYNLYDWLLHYFIPSSTIRNDIHIPNFYKFIEMIKEYQYDPCKRLIRNETDGSYYLDPDLVSASTDNSTGSVA